MLLISKPPRRRYHTPYRRNGVTFSTSLDEHRTMLLDIDSTAATVL